MAKVTVMQMAKVRQNESFLAGFFLCKPTKQQYKMTDVHITCNSREEVIAAIKHYVRNLPVENGEVFQCRFTWCATNPQTFISKQGNILADTYPYPPMPYAGRCDI